ncbi:MAG: hypothetical protein ACI9RU_002229 [Litorivivens sp.]|jgi:hypothetical protein
MKLTSIMNAVLVGFMIGVLIYGIVKNSLGFLVLIPLFFIYKVFQNSKKKQAFGKTIERTKFEITGYDE